MGLILKFAILFFCIKHLLDYSRPLITALIYAASFLILGLIGGLVSGWVDYGFILLLLSFVKDVAVGFAFFWLLDRYRDHLVLFYGIIVSGIALNFGFQFWASELTFPDIFTEEVAVLPSSQLPEADTAPPHLWSHHKILGVSAEVCAQRGVASLHSLSFSSVVRSGTYVYGNSGSNRAAVKCVEHETEGSFLYIAVAGPIKQSVEELRNKIAWSM